MTGCARLWGAHKTAPRGSDCRDYLAWPHPRGCAAPAGILQLIGWRQEVQCYSKSGLAHVQPGQGGPAADDAKGVPGVAD